MSVEIRSLNVCFSPSHGSEINNLSVETVLRLGIVGSRPVVITKCVPNMESQKLDVYLML